MVLATGLAPVIPALNDDEMEAVLTAAAEAGARSAGYVMLRMPLAEVIKESTVLPLARG